MRTAAAAAITQRCSYQRGCSAMRRTAGAAKLGVGGHSRSAASALSRCSRSVASGTRALLDSRSQFRQRAGQARLDGAFGDAQGGRSLLTAELEEVPACDHETVVLLEPVDEVQEPPPVLGRD